MILHFIFVRNYPITHQVLYPGKFRDRLLDGRFEVAILEIQSILPATYFRRRIRFLQHLCKILTSSSSRTFTHRQETCNSRETLIFLPRIFSQFLRVISDSTRRGIRDSHVPTATIVYLNYEYSINAKCRFSYKWNRLYTNERDVNIVDNAYVLEHDEDKVWNFGIEDGHREFEFEEEEEESVRRTVDTRLFLFFLSEGRNYFLSPLPF